MFKPKNSHNINASKSPKIDSAYLDKMGLFLIITWTLLLLIVLVWNCYQVREGVHKQAIVALRNTVDNDMAFRAWATEHGGVYVPITANTTPNPYLTDVNKTIFTACDGSQVYTLLNPAYIMRQVYALRLENTGLYNRLTSLDAINPINAADAWEAQALSQLEKNTGLQEITAITEFSGEPSIRFMKPFYIEPSCLKCHEYQGYKEGDLRGGISASLPLEPYNAIIHSRQLGLLPGYILIWLSGLAIIIILMSRLKLVIYNLRKNEARNRALIKAIPDALFRYDAQGKILDAEVKPEFFAITNSQPFKDKGELVGQNINDLFPGTIAAETMAIIKEVIASGKMQLIEHIYNIDDQEFYYEERFILEDNDEVISIVRDVTKGKTIEQQLEYLSYHDNLTGLKNRNFLDDELKRVLKSGEYPITVISVDVNGLKLINDTLGHIAGDNLLIKCAQVLKDSLRSSDVLARVGGDEFVAILRQASEQDGEEVIKRIQANIIKHNEITPHLPLSLSIGIATTKETPDVDILINTYKLADDLMYKEKVENAEAAKCSMVNLIMSSLKNGNDSNINYDRLKEACSKVGIDI